MVRIPEDGILVMYKEPGVSSHRVVLEVRHYTCCKVGHAGTLDLYASGVLVLGVGRPATKRLSQIVGKDKEYVTRIRLGCRSTSDDREGVKQPVCVTTIPSQKDVADALNRFLGTITQRPPAFSALKVKGKPAYKLARAHRPVDLASRPVEILQIELLSYQWPFAEIRLVTGPGVYVRAVARDLGEVLGTGAYVEELERIRVGPYTKDQAIRLCDLKRASQPQPTGEVKGCTIPRPPGP
jgi:tRNA pseudouridine55 synthase